MTARGFYKDPTFGFVDLLRHDDAGAVPAGDEHAGTRRAEEVEGALLSDDLDGHDEGVGHRCNQGYHW